MIEASNSEFIPHSAAMFCANSALMKKKADTASYSDELVVTVFTSIRNDNAGGHCSKWSMATAW